MTPHAITISVNDVNVTMQPSGSVARVSTVSVERPTITVSGLNIPTIATEFGEVEGLGQPSDYPNGVLVSALVLGRLSPEWAGIAFAPATGPRDGAIRNEAGHIVAVTKLVTV